MPNFPCFISGVQLLPQPGKLPTTRLLSTSLLTLAVCYDNVAGASLYSKKPYIRTLNFEGHAAVGASLYSKNSYIRNFTSRVKLLHQPGKLPTTWLLSTSLPTAAVRYDNVGGASLYSKNLYIRTLDFEGQASL